ncbi:condensation domain-containing protein [Streptomyces sp. Y1]|uniref:Condensation domain-containing protein n=1 Tax=Streptomyces sp. Y1 TaxID=3238634 RepID=A0AB39TTP4_9ACTN
MSRQDVAVDQEVLSLVLEAFSDVLEEDDLPEDVPFTVLGGSSLDGTLVCARVGNELGFPVPLSLLASHPTAQGFATALTLDLALDRARAAEEQPAVPEPAAEPGPATVRLTPMQTSFLTQHLMDPADHSPHLLFTWTLTGPLDRPALRAALQDVHHRHDPLNSRYLARRQAVAEPGAAAEVELLELPEATTGAAALDSTRTALSGGLDLAAGRVWRVALARAADTGDHVLRVLAHHIAFDGWSESVLAADLGASYDARLRGRRAELPPVAGAAARAGLRERQERLRQAELERQLAFWKQTLAGTPELVFPAADGSGQARFTTTLDDGELAAVDALAARHGVTRFAVLLTVYDRALAGTTGQRDYGVGFPVARRWDPALANVIDCCVDSLCLRMEPATRYGTVDLGEALRATAARLSAAYAATDVSFPEVVRWLNPPRTGRAPLFQNMFALQDNAVGELRMRDLVARRVVEPYLGLPTELHTEVTPLGEGRLTVSVSCDRGRVPQDTARGLFDAFLRLTRALPA